MGQRLHWANGQEFGQSSSMNQCHPKVRPLIRRAFKTAMWEAAGVQVWRKQPKKPISLNFKDKEIDTVKFTR